MSKDHVRALVSSLPRTLADQVLGYAESVERALPDIFRDARRERTEKLESEVIFIAGVKKLHWLAASSYWTLENSGTLLANLGVGRIRVGGRDVSRDSDTYDKLRLLLLDLDRALGEQNISKYLLMSWPEVVRDLASDGH